MAPDQWRVVRMILDYALSLRPEERRTWLTRALHHDAALQEEVTSLLEAHEQAGGFLEQPIVRFALAPPRLRAC